MLTGRHGREEGMIEGDTGQMKVRGSRGMSTHTTREMAKGEEG